MYSLFTSRSICSSATVNAENSDDDGDKNDTTNANTENDDQLLSAH